MRYAGSGISAVIGAVVLGASLSMASMSAAQGVSDPDTVNESTARPASAPDTSGEGRGDAGTASSSTAGESRPSSTPSEGYTWRSEKRKSHKQQRHRVRLDPNRPLVQAPSFQILADGTSVISLAVSRPVSVVESRVGKRLEYRLDTAQVGVENNLNPLVTGHFPTPLLRAALRRDKGAIVLVLHLRENASPTHVVRAGPAGVVLEITLPRPTRTFPSPVSADTSARDRRPPLKAPSASPGPGPRL